MRTAVYLRMSQDRTGEELGVQRHREDCHAFIQQRRWKIVDEYVDNDTGASSGKPRPEYERLLTDVQAGHLDVIVAWHLDRLIRRPADLERLIELCERHNVTIHCVRVSEIDPSTPSGRLIARQLGAYSRFEIEQKSDRQKREARQRADRGLPPGGRRAFGYNGAELVDGEAEAVKDAYRRFIAGKTLTSIAEALNEAGWKTTVGGKWNATGVRSMLLNPRYCGQRWYLGELRAVGVWPAIVDEATWEAVRTILTEPGRRKSGGNKLRWLGAGLYLCGRCSEPVPMKSTYRGILGRGTQARIYKCPACHMTRVAAPVDDFVSRVVVKRLRRPDLAHILAKPLPDIAPLQAEARALRIRRKEAKALFDEGELTATEFRESRAVLAEKLAAVESRMAAAGRGSALGEVLAAEDPGAAWLDRDVARQQAVVRELMTVRLLRVGPGRKPFDPTTVEIV